MDFPVRVGIIEILTIRRGSDAIKNLRHLSSLSHHPLRVNRLEEAQNRTFHVYTEWKQGLMAVSYEDEPRTEDAESGTSGTALTLYKGFFALIGVLNGDARPRTFAMCG
ncbi:unnamed protein product [Aspergillus oryzae]|uniref:Unnamed protein product n=1 Tax=Aspergillus oryzae TaxID=5062 RepID=A0AAN4YV43_ASPOZ|nr:unnamed protein product [Aspergillus oryzae]